MGQDESFYIVATGPGSKVYLGLKEEADKDEFYEMVRRAETKGVPFDHDKYVNSIPSKAGDLFLIPAGTVHASGRNEVVLEISATTYRYTFHHNCAIYVSSTLQLLLIYDHLPNDQQDR